jgi:hypothetical protein
VDVTPADPAPAPAPSPVAIPTALSGEPSATPPVTTWPDDWREKLALDFPEGDERNKTLTMLQRLNDPTALAKKIREQDKLISSGAHRKAPGADATPEQLAAYRAEIGVPNEPKGYLDKLPEGLVIGDDDAPLVDLFLNKMHAENAPPAHVNAALAAYYELQEVAQENFITEQTANKERVVDSLRGKWGSDYRANMNGIKNISDGFFGEASSLFQEAMLPDGTPLMNHQGILEGLSALARELNPGAAIIPAGGGNVQQGVDAEIAKIEESMNAPGGYEKHMRSPGQQQRYTQLIEAREKYKARGM